MDENANITSQIHNSKRSASNALPLKRKTAPSINIPKNDEIGHEVKQEDLVVLQKMKDALNVALLKDQNDVYSSSVSNNSKNIDNTLNVVDNSRKITKNNNALVQMSSSVNANNLGNQQRQKPSYPNMSERRRQQHDDENPVIDPPQNPQPNDPANGLITNHHYRFPGKENIPPALLEEYYLIFQELHEQERVIRECESNPVSNDTQRQDPNGDSSINPSSSSNNKKKVVTSKRSTKSKKKRNTKRKADNDKDHNLK
ncbi:6999_t:CDS:2 [Ambispora leptoticha]|uniref:6999_t:CDS:1 n=1 Tax=Ambispora leptoticha TaxID=144679 RepID=A0A9N9BHI4_9GLOM|nr:6999_t:CDS:2 [Ambispora leptoticha]